ncbi:MAG: stalk domain-containing protein [Caldiserica bacterium]|nr:stalk domain-containing protein [Caldisericota bacterium]
MTTTKARNYSLAATIMVLTLCLSLSLSGVLVHTAVVKAADANAWKQLPMYDGGVSILAVDPVHSSTLYATTAGGLFRSKDSGATWTAINGKFSTTPSALGNTSDFSNMSCFAINPKSPSTMFVGTNEGVFRTADGGTTWTACGTIPAQSTQPGVTSIAIDPLTPTTLYVSTNGYGAFRSADNGGSWKDINSELTRNQICWQIAVDPKTPTTVYAVTQSYVCRSMNSGTTWKAVGKDFTLASATYLAIAPLTPTTLYVIGYVDRFTKHVILRSVDGGATWKALSLLVDSTANVQLVVGSKTSSTLYARISNSISLSTSISVSTNRGDTWKTISTGLANRTVNSLAVDPKLSTTLYAGTSSGLFRSTNSGGWAKVNFPVAFTGGKVVGEMIVDPKTSTTMYQNCVNGVLYSHDSGMTWHTASATSTIGSVNHIAIDPKTPTILYACTAKEVFRSNNSGSTWTKKTTFKTVYEILRIIVDPVTPATLYVYVDGADAAGGVYRSKDSGDHWTAINNGFDHKYRFSSLTINPVIHTTLYLSDGSFYHSTDSGDHWTAMAIKMGPEGWDGVVALAINPANPSIMYAACTYTHYQQTLCRILRSTDGGSTWTIALEAGDALLGIDLYAIVLDPATPTTVYAAGDTGVIRSTDGGANWTDTGLHQGVTSLVVNPATATLYACTWHGVFSYNTSSSHTLTAVTSPSAGGSVVRSPDAVSYTAGTAATLTVTPATGYSFTGWSGDLSGTKNPETITMNPDKTVTASFVMNPGSTMKLTIGSKMISVDGKQVPIDASPDIFSSRTFIPIRIVTEVFGGSIAWDAAEQKVTIVRNGTTLNLWIGKSLAEIDGKSVSIDTNPAVVPVISYGRTLLPLRFVSESLGLDIQWDGTAHTITITRKS